MIAPRPEPSRWTRKMNGDDDKIRGYDDGECHVSERPAGYYIDRPIGEELDYYKELQGTNIY